MPVLSCPKCPTKLKVPDGAKGNVKCPKCATVFPVTGTGSSGGFEVVSETPAKTAPKSTASAPKPTAKAADDEGDDFEVVDEKPAKKSSRRDDDDDDDDRPRKKKRSDDDDDDDDDRPRAKKKRRDDDDDDDDDRPRSKKKRRDDDDDDDDDRPRKKKKRRDDDDEDDWVPKKKGKGGAFGPAKTGALLIMIGFWLYLATFGMMSLLVLISWASSDLPDGLLVIPGILGLANWIVSLVGLGFCIAGPQKVRGMAIAATVVASIHLILSFVCYSNAGSGMRGFGLGSNSFGWVLLASILPALDAALPILIYNSKTFGGDFIVAFLAAGCEVARLILILLLLKGLASAARDNVTAERTGPALMLSSGVIGGVVGIVLIATVIVVEGKMGKSLRHIVPLVIFLCYLGYTFMVLQPALIAKDTKDSCADRA